MEQSSEERIGEEPPMSNRRARRPGWASLAAAIFCTALVIEALWIAWTARQNGDMLVIICPLLGAVFISIPGGQAWVNSIEVFRSSRRRRARAQP